MFLLSSMSLKQNRVAAFVSFVIACAAVATVVLYSIAPLLPDGSTTAIVLLSALAIVAEMLSFLLPKDASGSIAFIPYLAMVTIVPHWSACLAIALVKIVIESMREIPRIKAIFNVGQNALTFALAATVYRLAGGESMLLLPSHELAGLTVQVGLPALLAFTTSFIVNAVLVAGVISLSTGVPVSRLLRENHLATVGLDLLAAPLVFVFAWVYTAFGPYAAATLWVPILGLRQVQTINLELQRTNQELLELMVKSIEARDDYTSGHSRRVQHYAVIIARAIGLTEKEVEQVNKAALLHDVGKIYEKYAPILKKEDKLSSEEWTTMMEHPIDGANLVATMSRLHDIVPSIRHHHENWNGTGYPDALAAEAIPLPARVIRFADTLDAMTTERPYRLPRSREEVKAEFIRCRGREFDPSITDRLLASALWDVLFAEPTLSRDGLKLVRSVSAAV
ncbi:MAG: metal dependent phosphohydrolase [Gemmatimonadetes bacterium]|nr:metal dependent phosphohydrolase [Gemmatimonadota bacterium]